MKKLLIVPLLLIVGWIGVSLFQSGYNNAVSEERVRLESIIAMHADSLVYYDEEWCKQQIKWHIATQPPRALQFVGEKGRKEWEYQLFVVENKQEHHWQWIKGYRRLLADLEAGEL